jgi:hypothetical protein
MIAEMVNGLPLFAVERPTFPEILNCNHKCMFIQLSSTHNKLFLNIYLATSFGSKFERIVYSTDFIHILSLYS